MGGGGRAGLGYKSTVFLTILLFRDFCFFPVSNFDISKRFSSTSFNCFMTLQIVFFLGLEFQPPPASLDLVRFQFDSVWDLKVDFFVILLFFLATFYCRILHFFTTGDSLPNSEISAKISCSTGFRDHRTTSNKEIYNPRDNAFPCETLFRN